MEPQCKRRERPVHTANGERLAEEVTITKAEALEPHTSGPLLRVDCAGALDRPGQGRELGHLAMEYATRKCGLQVARRKTATVTTFELTDESIEGSRHKRGREGPVCGDSGETSVHPPVGRNKPVCVSINYSVV